MGDGNERRMSDGAFWDMCAATALRSVMHTNTIATPEWLVERAADIGDAMLVERHKRTGKDDAK